MNKFNDNENTTEPMGDQMALTQMRAGQRGEIVKITGGHGLTSKLEALGIRKNREIKKISDQWMKGPVLLQHGHSQVAIGFKMASRIIVKVTGDGQ